MRSLLSELRIAVSVTIALALLVSGAYPILVWGIAQGLFQHQANGSFIYRDGKLIGSELLAQGFDGSQYFHPRPSSAGDNGYDAANSGGSNLGPTSKKLIETVNARVSAYRIENGLASDVRVPADAVTASASGLDPDISVDNALIQAGRVARARGLTVENIRAAIAEHSQGRWLGLLGEPRVNVLLLNLALDKPQRRDK
jgi:K+-transporting ATPase ATPase C chain